MEKGRRRTPPPARRKLLVAVGSFLAVVPLLGGLAMVRVWGAYQEIETLSYPQDARQRLETIPESEVTELRVEADEVERLTLLGEESEEMAAAEEAEAEALAEAAQRLAEEAAAIFPNATSPALPDEMFDSYLLIGSDASGFLADTIIYVLLPRDGTRPIMVSLPRDLYLPNPCIKRHSRLNAGLGGCRGYANGPTLLSLMVEDFTGVAVDHFALVNFDGFARVIDALGGTDICVEHPTRDLRSQLDLPAGCTHAAGRVALAWVRSRHTEQLIDGRWTRVGASDFSRQRHQQDLLFDLSDRMTSYSSLAAFTAVAQGVAESIRLDGNLSFGDAVSLAWTYRGIDRSAVARLAVPVEDFRTTEGAQVLLPTRSFNAVLASAYPPADRA